MRPLIAGDWKMHGMAPPQGQVEPVAAAMKAQPPSADILICLAAIIGSGAPSAPRLGGNALSTCASQIAGSVAEGMASSVTVIGCEPLWATGSGYMPTPAQIIFAAIFSAVSVAANHQTVGYRPIEFRAGLDSSSSHEVTFSPALKASKMTI
jgi:triosephosphate isomerase